MFFKTNCTKKLDTINNFFNITKAYKSKENILSANAETICSQDNRQTIIGRETCLKIKNKKQKTCKKLIKIVPIIAIFCHISQ